MDDLLRAFQILRKYGNPINPTKCEEGVMHVIGIDHQAVSQEDIEELKMLGFFVNGDHNGNFSSYHYGSST